MALIRLNAFSLPAANLADGDNYSVRFWYNYGFIDSAGQSIQPGSANNGTQIRTTASVSDGFLTVDDVQLFTTVDAQSPFPQSITLSCQVFKNNSALNIYPFNQTGCPSSWIIYNPDPNDFWEFDSLTFLQQASQPAYQQQWMVTNQEMIAYVNSLVFANAGELTKGVTYLDIDPDVLVHPTAVGANSYASSFHVGIVRLDVDPDVASDPVAVGINSPLLLGSTTFISTNYASLADAVTTIGSTPGTLLWAEPNFPTGSSCDVPDTLVIDPGATGSLLFTTGHVVTFKSDNSAWPIREIFLNALSGQGTVLWTGNTHLQRICPHWWGAVGDDATDCTTAIQAASDSLDTSNVDGSVWFTPGIYQLAGVLKDTSNSNAQFILPRRTVSMLTIRFVGVTPVPTIAFTLPDDGSVVLKSTLGAGTGNVIGGKVGGGGGVPIAGTSWTSVTFENIVIQTMPNPTISALDLTYYPNAVLRNVQINTGETTSVTEPTTATSYGLKLALNNIPDQLIVDNVQIYGFYNLMRSGELALVDGFIGTFGKVGIEVPEAIHAQLFGRVWMGYVATAVKFTGGDSTVEFEQLDIEHQTAPAWALTTTDISDPSNFGHGNINWLTISVLGGGVDPDVFVVDGGGNLSLRQLGGYTEAFMGFADQLNSVSETRAYNETSDDTMYAVNLLTADQTGTANVVGALAVVNKAIAAAEKRVGVIGVSTSGATNSSTMSAATMRAGSLLTSWTIDSVQNLILFHLLVQAEGGVLSVSGNAIAPTNSIHHVGAGLIKNITVPTGFTSGTIYLIPDSAFTYDATGNIIGTGTAVVGRTMVATYSSSSSKWFMSY